MLKTCIVAMRHWPRSPGLPSLVTQLSEDTIALWLQMHVCSFIGGIALGIFSFIAFSCLWKCVKVYTSRQVRLLFPIQA